MSVSVSKDLLYSVYRISQVWAARTANNGWIETAPGSFDSSYSNVQELSYKYSGGSSLTVTNQVFRFGRFLDPLQLCE